jgi:hypothetical protein
MHELANTGTSHRLKKQQFPQEVKRCSMKYGIIVFAATLLFFGSAFAITQQNSANQTSSIETKSNDDIKTGKEFVGKILEMDDDNKTITVLSTDTKSSETTNEGSKTFKYDHHTKFVSTDRTEQGFERKNLDKGDVVKLFYDTNDTIITISKVTHSEKHEQQ